MAITVSRESRVWTVSGDTPLTEMSKCQLVEIALDLDLNFLSFSACCSTARIEGTLEGIRSFVEGMAKVTNEPIDESSFNGLEPSFVVN